MKRIFLVTLAILMLFASGCTNEDELPTESSYYLEHGLDAHSYCIFMNKQITAVINQLSSQMILALKADNIPLEDLKEEAKNSLAAVTAAREQVAEMCPPEQYEENHENTLRMMKNAEEDLQKMVDILEETPLDTAALSSLASKMQVDFVALTSEFNIYYK